jgi:hypothetical protein
MKITVETPQAICTKCARTAPVRPLLLIDERYPAPSLFRRGEEPNGFSAVDDEGNAWRVLAAERPIGWTAGPVGGSDPGRGLCATCTEEWATLTDGFAPVEVPALKMPMQLHHEPVGQPVVKPSVQMPTTTKVESLPIMAPRQTVVPNSKSTARVELQPQPLLSTKPVAQAPNPPAPTLATSAIRTELSQPIVAPKPQPSPTAPVQRVNKIEVSTGVAQAPGKVQVSPTPSLPPLARGSVIARKDGDVLVQEEKALAIADSVTSD